MSRENRSGQNGIGSAISAILKRQAGNKKLHPHLSVLPEGVERENSYVRLASQIGARYAGCTLDNYKPTTVSQVDVLKKLGEYKEGLPDKIREGSGILWYGKVGTGKDHMAAAMLYEAVLGHGYRCRYIRASSFFEQLRSAIKEGISEKEILRPLEDPVILCISDVVPPVGSTTNYQTDAMYRMIDSRYRQRKTTWATLNVDDGSDAVQRLNEQIVDRLSHNALAICCDWESYRRRKGDAEKTV